MAKRKKPLSVRLASLALFIGIVLIVFNFTSIIKQIAIGMGWADLNWERIETIEVETDDTLENRADILHFYENILVHFKNQISMYDRDGNFLGKSEIQSVNNQVIGLEDYVVVIDKIQGFMTVVDYTGQVIEEIGPIGGIKDAIAASGNTFIVFSKNNYFCVYNYDGIMYFDYELPKGELLDMEVSKDKKTLLLTLLISDDEKFNSRLLTYDIDKTTLVGGNDNINTIVFGAMNSQDSVIIVDLKGQYAYPKGDPEHVNWSHDREGILNNFIISDNGNIIEIVEKNEVQDITGQREYRLNCINKDGREIFDIALEHAYENIDVHEGKILLQSDKDLMVYDSSGTFLTRLDSNKKIYGAKWIASNRLVIEYNDYLEIMELKY